MKTLVLGLGNLLMRDDGVGVHVLRLLRARIPMLPELALIDGGTLGLDLLPCFDGVRRLLIIDAIDMEAPPGTVRRLDGAEIPRVLAGKLSVHQAGLRDLLAVAELHGNLPSEVVVWGVQPGSIEVGLTLSAEVAAAVPKIEKAVLAELAQWGVEPATAC